MTVERWQVLPRGIGKPRPSAGVPGTPLRSRADAHEAVARLAACGWSWFKIERCVRGEAERWIIEAEPPMSVQSCCFSLMPFPGRLGAQR